MRHLVYHNGENVVRLVQTERARPEQFGTEPCLIADMPAINPKHLKVCDGQLVIEPVPPADPMNIEQRASYQAALDVDPDEITVLFREAPK